MSDRKEGLGMHPVTRAWARIDHWLAEHAPATLALLNPPADPHRIDGAQVQLGMRLPEDLAVSLACHDGATYSHETRSLMRILPPSHRPQPIDDIVTTWRGWGKVLAELEAQQSDMSYWLDRAWIPVATSHGGGDWFVAGQPGPRYGRLGESRKSDPALFYPTVPSLTALLMATADGLEEGRPVLGCYQAQVNERGGLAWKRMPLPADQDFPAVSFADRPTGPAPVDYASPDHAGEPHRGPITEAEKQVVRANLDAVNRRLAAKGKRPIDPRNPLHVELYGLADEEDPIPPTDEP